MSWSRCSSLLVALFLIASVVGPAAAVTVTEEQTHGEAEAGTSITAEYTLEELYQNPQTGEWTLNASTDLEDATWTVDFLDQQGSQVDTQDVPGQNISVGGIDPDSVAEVRVVVTGTVPEPDSYTYPGQTTFLLAELEQVREGGTLNTITTRETVHYTEDSRAARQAIEAAEAAIDEAETAGADVSDAKDNLETARSLYRNGESLGEAQDIAENAEQQATQSLDEAQSARTRNQLLLYGGVGVVAILLIGGGIYWYLANRQTHDKLG